MGFEEWGKSADKNFAEAEVKAKADLAKYHNGLLIGAAITVGIIIALGISLIIIQCVAKTYDFKNAVVEGGDVTAGTNIVVKGKLPVSKGIGIGYIVCSSLVLVCSVVAVSLVALVSVGTTAAMKQLKEEHEKALAAKEPTKAA